MRKYYVDYYADFDNTYNLYWADETTSRLVPSCLERITRKEAYRLARKERRQQKIDPAFSGFASTYIYPIEWSNGEGAYQEDWYLEPEDGVLLNWRSENLKQAYWDARGDLNWVKSIT